VVPSAHLSRHRPVVRAPAAWYAAQSKLSPSSPTLYSLPAPRTVPSVPQNHALAVIPDGVVAVAAATTAALVKAMAQVQVQAAVLAWVLEADVRFRSGLSTSAPHPHSRLRRIQRRPCRRLATGHGHVAWVAPPAHLSSGYRRAAARATLLRAEGCGVARQRRAQSERR